MNYNIREEVTNHLNSLESSNELIDRIIKELLFLKDNKKVINNYSIKMNFRDLIEGESSISKYEESTINFLEYYIKNNISMYREEFIIFAKRLESLISRDYEDYENYNDFLRISPIVDAVESIARINIVLMSLNLKYELVYVCQKNYDNIALESKSTVLVIHVRKRNKRR